MKGFVSLVNRCAYGLHLVSGAILVSMMFITLSDVITRAVFNFTGGNIDFTFIGGVELIKYGLLFAILFTLPHSVTKSQVIVDLFTEKMNQRLKIYLEAFYTLGFSLLGAGMSVRFYEAIGSAQMTGETTQDLLIPMHYLYSTVLVATSMLTLRSFILALELVFAKNDPAPDTTPQSDSSEKAEAATAPGARQQSQHKEELA
ncbi:TRAP transporter small permease [Photobacterium sanctipauli]|uniref:TRAP transporter small permease protein n=1 Tax=Photobacterium sanctipauli TaxID=1342794 RepID=A0A2T3P124_9GAMM|nr:TRAP transporter small permease [Photobacterium sanctipauli]PSW22226.1 TRAP transporter small permease [Photobacterium sanctipauli]